MMATQSDRSHFPTRRQFIKTGLAAGGLSLVPYHFTSAQDNATESPTDKLNLGIIGVGGRGRANTRGVSGENIYALCDVNQDAITQVREQFPSAKVFHDWRQLIDDPKIDGVVISTADHHHALASIAAMRAGKHVYCEKPLSHTVHEARLMQDEYKRRRETVATQMGTQIHATDNYRRVVEMIRAGAIGPVREAHVWCSRTIRPVEKPELDPQPRSGEFDWDVWLGPAPGRPYNAGYWKGGNLNWNRRWEFGNGVLGDMGSHLIDLPFWALDLHRPTTVQSEGPAPDSIACPPWQVATWEHAARPGLDCLDVPVKVCWYHGPEGMKRRSELLQPQLGGDTDISKWGIGVAFIGDKGLLVADYGRRLLSPSAAFQDFTPPAETLAPSLGHYQEWLQGCKTGTATLCNFDYSGALIEHNLLGNVAHRVGKQLVWDAETLQATNAPEASALVTKKYREGWEI